MRLKPSILTIAMGPVFVTKSGVPTGSNCSWSVTYTYEVKDACDNMVSPSPTVTYSGGDNTNPIVSCPVVPASVWPNSGSNYLNSGIGWDATATDNCSQPTLQYQLSGATQGIGTTLNNVTFNFGSTLVTWTATDGCGRTAVCSYIINVSDNEPPQITCPPTITVSCSTEVPASYVNYASFVVAGGSANDLSGLDESSFTLFSQTSDGNSCPETITRIYQIADILGNTAQCSQNVIVDDNTAPIFTTIAGTLNRTLQCNDATGIASAQALAPVATDNCDNTLVPVKTSGVFVQGTCPQAGSYTNTWTVTDDCGNSSAVSYKLFQFLTIHLLHLQDLPI
jgi:large repetitive protein